MQHLSMEDQEMVWCRPPPASFSFRKINIVVVHVVAAPATLSFLPQPFLQNFFLIRSNIRSSRRICNTICFLNICKFFTALSALLKNAWYCLPYPSPSVPGTTCSKWFGLIFSGTKHPVLYSTARKLIAPCSSKIEKRRFFAFHFEIPYKRNRLLYSRNSY